MSTQTSFAVFSTAIGDCAVAWTDAGLVGVWLPQTRRGDLRGRIARRHASAREALPSDEIARAIEAIRALLAGAPIDLRDVRVDMASVPPFNRRVYEVARTIAPGYVLTYGAVAARVGPDASARAVGEALGENRFPIVVPCHRVIAANGRLGGFSAPGGTATKRRMLAIENARLDGSPDLFDLSKGN
ncbi:MAG: methylated-DNA--[protein]-cysteine S-methyltransferase [Caldimonas sp.]